MSVRNGLHFLPDHFTQIGLPHAQPERIPINTHGECFGFKLPVVRVCIVGHNGDRNRRSRLLQQQSAGGIAVNARGSQAHPEQIGTVELELYPAHAQRKFNIITCNLVALRSPQGNLLFAGNRRQCIVAGILLTGQTGPNPEGVNIRSAQIARRKTHIEHAVGRDGLCGSRHGDRHRRPAIEDVCYLKIFGNSRGTHIGNTHIHGIVCSKGRYKPGGLHECRNLHIFGENRLPGGTLDESGETAFHVHGHITGSFIQREIVLQ